MYLFLFFAHIISHCFCRRPNSFPGKMDGQADNSGAPPPPPPPPQSQPPNLSPPISGGGTPSPRSSWLDQALSEGESQHSASPPSPKRSSPNRPRAPPANLSAGTRSSSFSNRRGRANSTPSLERSSFHSEGSHNRSPTIGAEEYNYAMAGRPRTVTDSHLITASLDHDAVEDEAEAVS